MGGAIPTEPLPDFTKWGEIERVPMRAVRRKTAEHLSVAWLNIPHVTQQEYADITGLEDLRRRYRKQVEAAGGNLTVTAVAVKIVAAALRLFPQFNTSLDMVSGEIIQKKYVNIGVAVDTDRGLLVPVIRNADQKSLIQIAVDLSQLSEKARSRKITAEEMQGGCFSISNLGGIGGELLHADREHAGGGHPGHLARPVHAGVRRGEARVHGTPAATAVTVVRPPCD